MYNGWMDGRENRIPHPHHKQFVGGGDGGGGGGGRIIKIDYNFVNIKFYCSIVELMH